MKLDMNPLRVILYYEVTILLEY